jgi:hypothetical protein
MDRISTVTDLLARPILGLAANGVKFRPFASVPNHGGGADVKFSILFIWNEPGRKATDYIKKKMKTRLSSTTKEKKMTTRRPSGIGMSLDNLLVSPILTATKKNPNHSLKV